MYRIRRKVSLNPTVTLMDIEAPLIAKKAEPGQFIILRVDEDGERIPLTIADFDREAGTVTIIFQIVGATTENSITKTKASASPTLSARSELLLTPTASRKSPLSAAVSAVLSPILLPRSCTTSAQRSTPS